MTAANATAAGGAGVLSSAWFGYTATVAATSAVPVTINGFITGLCGGGGSSNGTLTGGDGARGSGGGGGAASADGTSSGAGGKGGDGYLVVVCV